MYDCEPGQWIPHNFLPMIRLPTFATVTHILQVAVKAVFASGFWHKLAKTLCSNYLLEILERTYASTADVNKVCEYFRPCASQVSFKVLSCTFSSKSRCARRLKSLLPPALKCCVFSSAAPLLSATTRPVRVTISLRYFSLNVAMLDQLST